MHSKRRSTSISVDLKATGQALFGVYSADACQIFKKKSYFDPQRKGDITFDVVIEVTAPGRPEPQLRLVFECKNYSGSIPEPEVVDLSDKLGRLFQNGAKGFMVVSTRLQSGAENVARFRNIGIVKFDETGIENHSRPSELQETYLQNARAVAGECYIPVFISLTKLSERFRRFREWLPYAGKERDNFRADFILKWFDVEGHVHLLLDGLVGNGGVWNPAIEAALHD